MAKIKKTRAGARRGGVASAGGTATRYLALTGGRRLFDKAISRRRACCSHSSVLAATGRRGATAYRYRLANLRPSDDDVAIDGSTINLPRRELMLLRALVQRVSKLPGALRSSQARPMRGPSHPMTTSRGARLLRGRLWRCRAASAKAAAC
jgi:hypothetical protein